MAFILLLNPHHLPTSLILPLLLCASEGKGVISASMIADTSEKGRTPDELRTLASVKSFTASVFEVGGSDT